MTYSIDDIERLLASGIDRPVEIGEPAGTETRTGSGTGSGTGTGTRTVPSSEMPFTHLDHALQTATVLRQAGLVHDIGHLLPGVGDAEHAEAGAEAVRAALGDRVAGPVGLHVEAKRYLVARQSTYAEVLAADSVASLALQGGAMSADEQRVFERQPHAPRALDLRRADERGKVDGLEVAGLGEWMRVVRALLPAA